MSPLNQCVDSSILFITRYNNTYNTRCKKGRPLKVKTEMFDFEVAS